MLRTIEAEELRARLNDPTLTVVDVLPRVAFLEGHIPGALNLPLDEIESRARVVLPDRDGEIALYCGSET